MAGKKTTVGDDTASVVIDADFDALARRIMKAAQGASVVEIDSGLKFVASEARTVWYNQVDKETGRSGTVVAGWGIRGDVLSFAIGNMDTRIAPKTGKPVLYYIHRPGPFSEKSRPLTAAEKAKRAADGERAIKYIVYRNPKASDGRYLVVDLIRKPANARYRRAVEHMARKIGEKYANNEGPPNARS